MAVFQPQSKKIYWFLILVFILFSAMIGTGGYFFHKDQKKTLKQEKWDQISAIANLKAKQITDWRRDRMEDADIILESPYITKHFRDFLEDPKKTGVRQELLEFMSSLQKRYHYQRIFFLNPKGVVRLSSPEGIEMIGSQAKELALEAIRQRRVILSDFYRSETTHLIRLSLLIPLIVPQRRDVLPVGVLLLRIDPYQFLYPLIQSWPTPSRSSESLLVRREGDEVLFLNDLVYKQNTALKFRLAITEKHLPAVMAVLEKEGMVEGVDYRGVPVLAALRKIPDSPWYLVAKVDQEEIYTPINMRMRLIVFIIGLLIVGTGLMVRIFWRKQQAQYYKQQFEAEHEYRKLMERYEYLTQHANDIILLMDQDLKVVEANERAVEQYGYSREELLQKNLRDLRSPETLPLLGAQIDQVKKQNGAKIETYHLRKAGTRFPVENSSRVIEVDGKPFYQSIIRDITERKRAEEALRESEEKYRILAENAGEAIFVAQEGMLKFVNPRATEMIGYSLEELTSRPFIEFIHLDDRALVLERYTQRLQGEAIPSTYDFRIIPRSGDPRWVELNTALIEWQGKPATLNFLIDITERKRAEEALRKSGEKFRELFDNAPVGYHEFDVEGRITNVNRTELEMLGYTLEERIGQFVWGSITEEEKSRQTVLDKLAGVIPPSKSLERTYHRKDGTTFPVLIQDQLLRDPEGKITGIRSTIQDITERKRAEQEMTVLQEQFRQSQKMEAIGHLAGGIAHDFNNLLTIISGNAQLSLLDLKQGDPLRENIEEIRRASERAADLTRQLLAFSRKQVMEVQVLDLNHVVQGLDKMLHRLLGEDIDLVTVLPEGIGRVKADPGQIEQVIVNLAVNARDAMIEGGKLTIETANVELDEEYAHKHMAVQPGRYVMLSVSDTGVGMTPEVKERIFEPFFTTKEMGKGTGLGLSTVYGIVKQSGGNIWVYSEPDKGTTFKIYLPGVDEPIEESEEKGVKEEILTGSETILVVEDDEEVRNLAVRILKKQGYNVLEASQGLDAFLISEEHEEPMHLLLTDVVMPKISGRELADRIASIHPEIKVLYMSGYTDNTIAHHGILEPGIKFVQKPFTVDGLARKVREALDK